MNNYIMKQFRKLLPADCYCDDPQRLAPHLREWRDTYQGNTPLMLMPRTTEQLQAIVKLAGETETLLCVQGGNTGLVGGNTPGLEGRQELLVSLQKMNSIEAPCPHTRSMIVGAGAILHQVQEAAEAVGLKFPLSLASEGSCTIGGTIATNAGGIHVIKYGTMRALVSGIEAVLPDGSIINTLHGLVKDNTGYDLTNLLIGAEGTLGIVTKARIKLFPQDKTILTGWLTLSDASAAIEVLSNLQSIGHQALSAFELIGHRGLDFVIDHMGGRRPVDTASDWSVLFEMTSPETRPDWPDKLETLLGEMMEAGLVLDGTLAGSMAQRKQLWSNRENISEAQKFEGGSIKHDISLPLMVIPDFLAQAAVLAETVAPGCRPVPFGHMGDGNIHYNISQPINMNKQDYLALAPEMNTVIHDLVCSMGGSISAEHGIGTLKRDELAVRHPEKVAAIRAIKSALDPKAILNRGRVINQ